MGQLNDQIPHVNNIDICIGNLSWISIFSEVYVVFVWTIVFVGLSIQELQFYAACVILKLMIYIVDLISTQAA